MYIYSFLRPAPYSSLHFGAVFPPPTKGDVETLAQARPRTRFFSLCMNEYDRNIVSLLSKLFSLIAATDGTAVVTIGRGSGLLQGRHVSQVDEDDTGKDGEAESYHADALSHLMGHTPAHRHDKASAHPVITITAKTPTHSVA